MSFFTRWKFALKFDGNFEVKIPIVPLVGLHGEGACDRLSVLGGHVIVEVEDSLLPVSVASLGGGGESSAFVAFGELDVEVCDDCVHVIVPAHLSK